MRVPALCFLAGAFFASTALALQPTPASTARILPIAADGYAGSSANVVAGLQNAVVTHGHEQFAAFYRADGRIVIGQRRLGADAWTTTVTDLLGQPDDAHRTLALAVDGEGFLHLVWGQHNDALRYARGRTPLRPDFVTRATDLGTREGFVTYPAFLKCPNGDLLLAYRDGESGRGDMVLNRYQVATQTWTRVQDALISGEGRRSAYPALHLDTRGLLHLAWVWRESPDVASNHDLAYARSRDLGRTWETVAGEKLPLPITAATASYALRIPENHNLMNPPALTADSESRPLLVNYWSDTPDGIPQMRLVRFTGNRWQVEDVSARQSAFRLAGTNTKRPPLSRAVVVARDGWRQPSGAAVVYRDDEQAGRAVLAYTPNLDESPVRWRRLPLTEDALGGWEPSYDVEQWQRLGQLHLLLQAVKQRDGDDSAMTVTPASEVATLLWSPFLFGHAENRALTPPPTPTAARAGQLEAALDPGEILTTLRRVTAWQLAFPYQRDPRGWEIAPFYLGALAVAQVSGATDIETTLQARFSAQAWSPAPRDYHADDYCVTQAYAELYRKTGDKAMLAPSLALFQRLLARPSQARLDWNSPQCLDRWSWCDALFMAPASWLDAYLATGDRAHVDFMNREWWLTTDTLFHSADGFYARDESYLDLREPNGRRLYWSRGNGWVAAGLARTLARFPRDHKDRPRYEALFTRMMDAVLAAQQPDGLWRPGLLDPAAHPAREVSGTSFYTFALAWGVNHGYLERERFEPAIRRAWNGLQASVRADGKLEDIQPIGAAPEGFDPTHTDAFGVGAFLLAGAEVHRLVTGTPEPLLAR